MVKKIVLFLLLSFSSLFSMKRFSLDEISSDLMSDGDRYLVTGISGQDGAEFAKYKKNSGDQIVGLVRPTSDLKRLQHAVGEDGYSGLFLCEADLCDPSQIVRIFGIKPTKVLNFAAISSVRGCENINLEASVNILGLKCLLQAMSLSECRLVQAGSSEIFGNALEAPQTELIPPNPRNKYGESKEKAYAELVGHRNIGKHASLAFLYNHTGPLRGRTFVTRQIIHDILEAVDPNFERTFPIKVGNLSAVRDFSAASEVVRGMDLMLDQEKPDDYILASGQTYSIRRLVEIVFSYIGRELEWIGEGKEEKGYDRKTKELLVEINERFWREAERVPLVGDPTKAREVLGWQATTKFEDLIVQMVEAEKMYMQDPEKFNW